MCVRRHDLKLQAVYNTAWLSPPLEQGPRGQLEVSCFPLSLVFPSQAHNPTYMHNIICPQEYVGTFQFPMVVLFSIMTFEILSLALLYPK